MMNELQQELARQIHMTAHAVQTAREYKEALRTNDTAYTRLFGQGSLCPDDYVAKHNELQLENARASRAVVRPQSAMSLRSMDGKELPKKAPHGSQPAEAAAIVALPDGTVAPTPPAANVAAPAAGLGISSSPRRRRVGTATPCTITAPIVLLSPSTRPLSARPSAGMMLPQTAVTGAPPATASRTSRVLNAHKNNVCNHLFGTKSIEETMAAAHKTAVDSRASAGYWAESLPTYPSLRPWTAPSMPDVSHHHGPLRGASPPTRLVHPPHSTQRTA